MIYTSPARGHLYPAMGPATELSARGHEVHVVTLSGEIDLVRSQGLFAESIDGAIESREMDDYKGKNPMEALALAVATFADRAPIDRTDLQHHIDRVQPDVLIIDTNSWGALAAAEASGIPWCSFQPYFTPPSIIGHAPIRPRFRAGARTDRSGPGSTAPPVDVRPDEQDRPALNQQRAHRGR
ncbi:MAG: hypothetical protein WD995_08905, partial [Gemmatimonadota bacterium]